MGKFKHDGSSVDLTKGGYQGEQPKPAIYPAELVICEEHTTGEGNDATHWVFEISEGPYRGWRGHVFTNDEGALWKQDQILVALGLQRPGGSYSGTHEGIVKKGGPVKIRTIQEEYNDEKRAKIRTIMPPSEGQEFNFSKVDKVKKKKEKVDAPF